ncbi:MAG: hypothetical protein NTU89_02615 [Candidatus Dependentiae bacterium]|nr:hypothetical protein [Candidatus Dependentiae bacterium]
MKKLFLKITVDADGYGIPEGARTESFSLGQLVMFLEAWGDKNHNQIYTCNGLNWEWLSLGKTRDEKSVYLWDNWEIKKQAKLQGLSQQEQEAFDKAYEDYSDKRFEDIPKLYMKIENYVEVVEKWQEIVLKQKPNFIILSQDDSGYVDLVGKDELSQQDLADMKIEHEKYLKYKIAYDKYVKSRPDIVDELWHGPQSSEYEADWQKFYEPDDEK